MTLGFSTALVGGLAIPFQPCAAHLFLTAAAVEAVAVGVGIVGVGASSSLMMRLLKQHMSQDTDVPRYGVLRGHL